MKNTAYLKHKNPDDLHDVIDWLNERYKSGSRSFSFVDNMNALRVIRID